MAYDGKLAAKVREIVSASKVDHASGVRCRCSGGPFRSVTVCLRILARPHLSPRKRHSYPRGGHRPLSAKRRRRLTYRHRRSRPRLSHRATCRTRGRTPSLWSRSPPEPRDRRPRVRVSSCLPLSAGPDPEVQADHPSNPWAEIEPSPLSEGGGRRCRNMPALHVAAIQPVCVRVLHDASHF
jgi:hypothetical protein